GWDFTSKTAGGDNIPEDDLGHGTHIAGIIAAVTNNNIGITGLSNKLKILPIKVLNKNEEAGGKGENGSLTDRIAKGLLFAIKSGAKVINMSLGWPLILDTNYLRETIKEVLRNNITIVAAAGNNNNNSPIFPCAYKGVICVGSINVDGNISGFSNYGGYVDVLAPGDDILSTIPLSMDSDYFSVKGYDLKNGTSQASPFIAGIAGILKGINPDISEDEIKARIFKSAKKFNNTGVKFTSFGAANLKNAIQEQQSPVILPLFKDINSIDLLPNSKEFKFSLDIKNFWGEAKNIKLIIKELSGNFILSNDQINLESLKEGETKEIFIQGECKNWELDNNLNLEIEVWIENKLSGTFRNDFLVSRSIVNSTDLAYAPIMPEGISGKIGTEKDGAPFPLIRTVLDKHFILKYPVYYLAENLTEEEKTKGLRIEIIKYLNGSFKEIENDIIIPNGTKLLSVILNDSNYDGTPDLFITSLGENDGKPFLIYSYFGMDGRPLYGNRSHIKFIPESVVLNLKKLAFIPYEMEGLGKIAIPLFMEKGILPENERATSSWDTPDYSKSSHIYYLIPEKVGEEIEFKTKIIDNKKWTEKVKVQLNLEWNDDIFISDLLPQNLEEFQKGEANALITVGKNYFMQSYLLKINLKDGGKINPLKTDLLRMEGHMSLPTINLNGGTNYFEGTSFVGQYTDTTITISHLADEIYSNIFRQDNQRDHILGPIAVYKKNGELFTFFQTKSKLKLHRFRKGEKETISEKPITRFSFLPGILFTESFYPIVKGNKEAALPALYIDATQISRKDIYILTLDKNNQVISPIKYNIRVPNNCKSMNPVPFGEDGTFSFALFCLEETIGSGSELKEKWGLRFLKLK
ncbi:MAG: S8 family peptidase, partial [Bacteriovoracales bacterium]